MSAGLIKKLFSISIFAVVIIVCVYLFFHSAFFQIDKIYVTGLDKIAAEEIIQLSGLTLGTNIFKVNEALSTNKLQLHPLIKDVKILRHLPGKIEIKVTEREIWAQIPYQDLFLYIDEESICLDKASKMTAVDTPIITVSGLPEYIHLGQPVAPQGISLIVKIWNKLSLENREKISDFHYNVDSDELFIYTIQGTEIRFGNEDRLEEKIMFFDQLFTIEEDLQKQGKNLLEYVDLKYKGQPVIKTKV